MDEARSKVWAGIDAGKEFHWAHVLDASGKKLLSRKVTNDEADLSALIDEALSFAEEVVWAIDQLGGAATLLLGLLWKREQRVFYMPGLTVDRSRDTYRGEAKTDARDAHVIADQARMRGDLEELTAGEGELAELEILLARRRDLVTDQTRSINRLRDALLSSFPALERALDFTSRGALILASNYQTPAAIRRMGRKRLASFLRNRGVKGADALAGQALTAAKSQNVTLPAEEITSRIVAELAGEVLALKKSIETLDGELSPTVPLVVIALRSAGWSTVTVPIIDHFRAILGSQKGLSGLFNGSLGLSGTVGLESVFRPRRGADPH